MPAVALLAHNGVYGSARFHTAAKRNGIRAHIGAEISVPSLGTRLTPPTWLPHQHIAEPVRLPLLCESREGYQNLCQLITRFKLREKSKGDGSARLEEVQEYSRGLICLTGGDEGPLAAALARGGEDAGRSWLNGWFESLVSRTSTWSCNGTVSAKKNDAIKQRYGLLARGSCHCWRRTECGIVVRSTIRSWARRYSLLRVSSWLSAQHVGTRRIAMASRTLSGKKRSSIASGSRGLCDSCKRSGSEEVVECRSAECDRSEFVD